MPREMLPLFPLGAVLLPGSRLPLHIFEDRYKEMIGAAIDGESEFGIVLAKDEGIARVGCTAVVEEVVRRYPDGRMDIVALGQSRFEIESLNQDKGYLRAEVKYFEDEPVAAEPPSRLIRQARRVFDRLRRAQPDREIPEPEDGSPTPSFQFAQVIDDADFRQHLLVLRSETDRLQHIVNHWPEYEAKRRLIARLREVAPSNGHGKWPRNFPE